MSDSFPSEKPLQERLQALADFLPIFEEPGFRFGEWAGGSKNESGMISMPYFSLSEEAHAFLQMAYAMDWVTPHFDWPSWSHTEEAHLLGEDPAVLAEASPQQLAKLLTVLIRQDRFSEGALASAYERGLLTGIVRRAAGLAAEMG